MAEIERRGIFTLVYRLMMEDRSVYVQMSAAMVEEQEGPRLIVGLNNIDAQYRKGERNKEIARQREIFTQITLISVSDSHPHILSISCWTEKRWPGFSMNSSII